jgi:SAM-dependent methyltransferase
MLPTREDAISFPRGRIELGFCRSCGFISNMAFAAEKLSYSTAYEETQGFSPRFNTFARELARKLVEKYDLRNKQILEIGCGKGEFLNLLCEIGGNMGVGLDPAYIPGRLGPEADARIRFVQDFYSERYAHLKADFICCRHTLEHIAPTRDFLRTVRGSIGDRRDTIVFFEVPDVARVLREPAFWDVYYEHCSYFTLGSLGRLFQSCGFEVLDLATDFDDQYLLIEAQVASPGGDHGPIVDDIEDTATLVARFVEATERRIRELRAGLAEDVNQDKRVVLWGSGSKAVAYLNALQVTNEIEFVVDINPFKHGKYLAGSGAVIVSPEFLQEYQPDVVIVMNPIYVSEINDQLQSMGLTPRVIAI